MHQAVTWSAPNQELQVVDHPWYGILTRCFNAHAPTSIKLPVHVGGAHIRPQCKRID